MKHYETPKKNLWTGKITNKWLYLHEKVHCTPLYELPEAQKKSIALLGYACDAGVHRNQGRVGAAEGPDAIKSSFGKMPNHLGSNVLLHDVGSITCSNSDMESAQEQLAEAITSLLEKKQFPIVLGGGHDLAYGHYQGIKTYLDAKKEGQTIGIINFDAHFDLQKNTEQGNSGTPFYQIAKDCKKEGINFNYLCLGIRKDANDRNLFQTARDLDVIYVMNDTFQIPLLAEITTWINAFTKNVDHIYVTIDLDGFSSAFAPGVSAPSPMGFTPHMVLECLKPIIASGKLISMDIAEMNPKYDIDGQTAKLAASLVHHVAHSVSGS
ncbi:formimidoylglutamase [Flagellimonas zhangzhouensis]|uniref:Formimidoylglutamase n=1 Tax=Flagellimonas zhangzhouensis TaxID=1073328 RepID=A0A1H2WPS9_9FLAO|nr:formimidoylglutamase [Allomuricauda zhangzhouensis]SDQ22952.1 formiminoglutamase [Allomuricauda zhangzhouensis]SDW81999.1 formiminoglutamase [Allomuricauda zhangzhouensis]